MTKASVIKAYQMETRRKQLTCHRIRSRASTMDQRHCKMSRFLGYCSSYLLREGLSVAIVAMVNHTAVTDEDVVMSDVTEDQCPRDPELRYEDGELNWDRNQQGIVLAAFYYGYGFTQVCNISQAYFRIRDPRLWPQVSLT